MDLEKRSITRSGKTSSGWIGLLALLAATACLAVLLAGSGQSAYAQSNQGKTPAALAKLAAWQNDLKAWESRWNALIAQRLNPVGPINSAKWATLESDLSALAKKYGQANEEHVRKQTTDKTTTMGAGGGEFSDCAPRDDIPGYRCYLFPGPKGVCRYVCTPIDKKPK
jgi:hypothetical protein